MTRCLDRIPHSTLAHTPVHLVKVEKLMAAGLCAAGVSPQESSRACLCDTRSSAGDARRHLTEVACRTQSYVHAAGIRHVFHDVQPSDPSQFPDECVLM